MAQPAEFKDYYAVLGIDDRASLQDIKQAYRRLARQLHPDLNPNDVTAEERFKLINEAYGVLSDRHLRDRYDCFGLDNSVAQNSGRHYASKSQRGDDFEEMEFGRHGSFEDLLGDLFNRYG